MILFWIFLAGGVVSLTSFMTFLGLPDEHPREVLFARLTCGGLAVAAAAVVAKIILLIFFGR